VVVNSTWHPPSLVSLTSPLFLGSDWYIYDVGGSRGSRHQWVPYFDDGSSIPLGLTVV
jgi:hypothetical protein